MRAAVYTTNGSARDVLSLVELPTPAPGPGEVRVKVACSGVNPSDVKTRLGLRAKLAFPRIVPHCDGAGVIDEVGAGVPPGRVGERVWLWNAQWGRAFGTAAEFVTLPSAQAVRLPDSVSFAEGACLGVPLLTAWHAVTLGGGLAGRTVLVAGGAGGVGHYAVQVSRLTGAARVIATVSGPEKALLARAAGAHEVINYRTEDIATRVAALTGGRGVDRILEVDFSANVDADFDMVARDGHIVPYGSGRPQIAVPFFPAIIRNVRLSFFIVYNLTDEDRRAGLTEVTALMDAGRLTHNVAVRLPLTSIVEAHELVEQGGAMGNVVLDI